MNNKIYIIPIEKITTRYSCEWYDHIPKLLDAQGQEVVIIEGDDVPPNPTPGAFLDFGATNIFKSSQLMTIAQLFRDNKINPGDKFLYTDAWNPTVIQIKYISSLLNIPIEIHGMWHAGHYDKFDFLGRLIGNQSWIQYAEQSMFHCYDYNWFATRFHMGLFAREILDVRNVFSKDTTSAAMHAYKNINLTGWPMEYLNNTLEPYSKFTKKKQIVFPHRIAPEKQLDIFKDLESAMPEYNWIVCQEKILTKDEYHSILGESTIVFSASLQETLGISQCAEGPLCGAIPLSPNRLSYTEIFENYNEFLYPSEWTLDFNYYLENKTKLINKIQHLMLNSDYLCNTTLRDYVDNQIPKYFTANNLVNALVK
jgi:hypothetical protein